MNTAKKTTKKTTNSEKQTNKPVKKTAGKENLSPFEKNGGTVSEIRRSRSITIQLAPYEPVSETITMAVLPEKGADVSVLYRMMDEEIDKHIQQFVKEILEVRSARNKVQN